MVNATSGQSSINAAQKAQEQHTTIQFIQNFNSTINTFIKQYNQIKLSSSSASCLTTSAEYDTSKMEEKMNGETKSVAYVEEDLELA
jgi:hypothetical protein